MIDHTMDVDASGLLATLDSLRAGDRGSPDRTNGDGDGGDAVSDLRRDTGQRLRDGYRSE